MVRYYVNPDQFQNSTYLEESNTAGRDALLGNGFQEVNQDIYKEALGTGRVSSWNQKTVAPGIDLTNTNDANKSAKESADFQNLNNPTLPSPGSQSVSGQNGYNNNSTNPLPNISSGGSSPVAPVAPLPSNPFSENLQIGSSGNDVARLQQILNTQGANLAVDGKYGPLTAQAVKDFQTKNGLTVDGIFGPKSSGALTTAINAAGNPTEQPGSSITTSLGRIDPTAPVSLSSGGSSTFDSSSIGSSSTADVLSGNQTRQDDINSILQKQADAFSVLNQLKAESLQGKANIMYGRGGAGGSDADLQGKEQEMFDRQQAFKTLPAEIAYNSAQMALSLYKQTPAYLTETQARDTAFNMLQNYPDINYAYNPSLSAQANLQNIKEKLPSSTKYQASLVNYKGYVDVNGVFHMYNSKDTSGTPTESGAGSSGGGGSITPVTPFTPAPSSNNPVTPAGTYLGVGTNNVTTVQPLVDKATTRTQVDFVKDWTSGSLGTARNSLNTALGHLFEADGLFSSLNNGDIPFINAIGNFSKTAIGGAAASNYMAAQTLASSELAGAYGGDAASDREKLAQFGGASQSPAQHAGYITTATNLLASKLSAVADQYKSAFGHYPASLDSLMSPVNQIKLNAISGTSLNTLVPGVHVSPSTQALLNSYRINKQTGKIALPTGTNGSYEILK